MKIIKAQPGKKIYKHVEETDPNFIGPVLPTYSGGNMNAAVTSASLPSIQTAHGKRIAHNMAKRVVAGQMQMGQVPRSYRSYVEGEAKGAIPMTDFMNTAGKYVAAGTAATVAAPWLLSLTATAPAAIGTELGTYGNIYGNLARTMLLDVPAFEAVDRIPTLWGGNRLTVQGGNLAERGYRAVMPESRFTDATAPFVNQAGQLATGFPVGTAGHGLMQGMYGAMRPVDDFIYSRRLMDNYSKERLAADEAGDTESIKSIDALITKGANKGDITGLSYYRGNEPGDLGSTTAVMGRMGSDSNRLAPGHRLSLIGDYDLSKDSYPLLQRVLLRNQRNGVGDIRLVTDNGVPRMIKLNSDGTGKGSLSAIDKGIDMLRTELGNPDIPGRVSLFGTHYVPAIEFYKYPYHFDGRMPLSRPISEAEKLGIPKGERSNPKALEDPYYWGYKQWNNKYNAAVESGNWDEVQRLRDLHFKVKAPNTKIIDEAGMPKEVYHGSGEKFTVFDSSKTRPDYDYGTSTNMFSDNKNVALGYANNDPDKLHSVYLNLQNTLERDFKGNPWNGSVNNSGRFAIVPSYETTYSSKQEAETALQKMLDLYYPNNPAKQAEQRHYMYVKELADSPHLERSTNAFSDEIANSPILDGGIIKNVKDYYNLPKFDENPELYKELTSPHTDYFVKDPRNIKSSAIITRDDFGRIIPIVKRDNFHNPDIRYKQGGNI